MMSHKIIQLNILEIANIKLTIEEKYHSQI